MKKSYSKHKTTLGETGHGLVTSGLEQSIVKGSDIANAWGNASFLNPFYLLLTLA